ncbi:MAG: hypothetical protein K1X78_12425 [Verrucomicrobiaceae bacterium]|nr:hypothetical protein [Verrucomicrobiaceae bacterium]
MKPTLLFVLSLVFTLGALNAQAQDPDTQVRVKVKNMKVDQQYTPDYTPRGVTEKRWKPKQWLEIDTEIDVDIATELGGKEGVYPALEFKYFVAVNGKTKEGKPIVLTGTLTFENVPNAKPGEPVHALAYVTPATLKGAVKKDLVGKADVQAVGLEIHAGGKMLKGAFHSDKGRPWWIGKDNQPDSNTWAFQDGAVIPKSRTPFAPLWADYDLQSKEK